MNYCQDSNYKMDKEKEDCAKIEESNKMDSIVSIDTQKKDVDQNCPTLASPPEDNPDSLEAHSRRKLFPHHSTHSPARTRTTRNGSFNHSSDTETYQGSSILQSSPSTQMEAFISSPSTLLIRSFWQLFLGID